MVGLVYLIVYALTLHLSVVYIPPNQLTVHRSSAKLKQVPLEHNNYGFELTKLVQKPSTQERTPFIFVHGHKGNVKQAISMSQFFEKKNLKLDMYSVDFKDAAVGLSHSLMYTEAEFLNKCLLKVAQLHPNKSIGLITHSMGGIVASLALSLPSAPVDKVFTMIALSTPFEAQPVNSYLAFPVAYNKVHNFWKNSQYNHIFTLSITGGIRDLVVPSQLTNIQELIDKNALHVYSTQIEGLHFEMDHLAVVWATEFFEKLTSAVKLIVSDQSNLKAKVKDTLECSVSKMLYHEPIVKLSYIENPEGLIELTEPSFVASKSALEFYCLSSQKYYLTHFKHTLVKNKFMYKVSQSKCYTKPSELWVQPINEFQEISFFKGFLGQSLYFEQEALGVNLSLGPAFSQTRYPIRIVSEKPLQVVHARCSGEEIIKYNQNDLILYFHEYCQEGPQIWALGVDSGKIDLNIDILASIVCLARDFRLTVVSYMVMQGLLSLVSDSKLKKLTYLGVAGALYLGSCFFRVYGFLGLDHVHNPHTHYGLIDILYLFCIGEGLFVACKATFYLLKYLSLVFKKAPKRVFECLCLVLVYFMPWPAVCALTLLVYSQSRTINDQVLFVSLLQLILTLPQQISWYVILHDHRILETLNPYDALNIFPYLLLLFSCVNNNSEVSLKTELLVSACYLGVCTQDLLYRANFFLSCMSAWVALKLFFSKKKLYD